MLRLSTQHPGDARAAFEHLGRRRVRIQPRQAWMSERMRADRRPRIGRNGTQPLPIETETLDPRARVDAGLAAERRDGRAQRALVQPAQPPVESTERGALLRPASRRRGEITARQRKADSGETHHRLIDIQPPEGRRALGEARADEQRERRAMPTQDRQRVIEHVTITVIEGERDEARSGPGIREARGNLVERHDPVAERMDEVERAVEEIRRDRQPGILVEMRDPIRADMVKGQDRATAGKTRRREPVDPGGGHRIEREPDEPVAQSAFLPGGVFPVHYRFFRGFARIKRIMVAEPHRIIADRVSAEGVSLTVTIDGPTEAAFTALVEAAETATPFQSPAWLRHNLAAREATERFRLVTLRNDAGAVMLPLELTSPNGVRLAGKIGGAHASFLAPARHGEPARWSRALIRAGLARAGALLGLDAILLADCPREWAGAPNPLASLPHRRAPNDGSLLTIDTDAETMRDRLLDRGGRKKLRQKLTKLGETGVLDAGWIEPAATGAALETFYAWKSARFGAAGIADPFEDMATRRFLAMATADPDAPVRLYRIAAGGRMIALIGGARSARHFSGMFTAYDPAPEFARHSPGQVLLHALIADLCAAGFTGFDLGAGDADYKTHVCPTRIPLFDAAVPVTSRGAIATAIWRTGRSMKAAIKRNARLYAFATGLRRILVR